MALLTCSCAFPQARTKCVSRSWDRFSFTLLSYVCFPLCVLICVLSYVCTHLCALTCVLSYARSPMCALICVLSYVLSYVCSSYALIYVLSHVCSPLCALICVLSSVLSGVLWYCCVLVPILPTTLFGVSFRDKGVHKTMELVLSWVKHGEAPDFFWLVVSTPLKNMERQLGWWHSQYMLVTSWFSSSDYMIIPNIWMKTNISSWKIKVYPIESHETPPFSYAFPMVFHWIPWHPVTTNQFCFALPGCGAAPYGWRFQPSPRHWQRWGLEGWCPWSRNRLIGGT